MSRIQTFFIEPTGKVRRRKNGKSPLYRRTDTGEEIGTLGDAPVGAMWFAPWLDDLYEPQLEHVLIVKTPGGDWVIDSEASNCTQPTKTYEDNGRTYQPKMQTDHHCWIIHGTPPEITVDKNGVTCGAGAGSIQCGNYHGFLRGGFLED